MIYRKGWVTFYMILISIWVRFLILSNHVEAIDEIKIGIILRNEDLEEPLNRTLEMLNADNSVLLTVRLRAIVEIIDSDNSYQISTALCRLLSQKVWVIIGPQSIQSTPIIRSITTSYHIPLVLINWQPNSYYLDNSLTPRERTARQSGGSSNYYNYNYDSIPNLLNYTINLYPVADQLSIAYSDLIRYKNWKRFSLIYDSPEDFIMVKDIFELSFSGAKINIMKIDIPTETSGEQLWSPEINGAQDGSNYDEEDNLSNADLGKSTTLSKHREFCDYDDYDYDSSIHYRKLMKDLRKRGVENIVLCMSLEKVCRLLKEAQNVGLLSIYNDYIIANLDTHLLNFTGLQPMQANITGYSILDPSGQQTDFTPSKKWLGKRPVEVPKRLLTTEYSMMSDAVSLVAMSLDEMLADVDSGKSVTQPTTECGSTESWSYGELLMDIMKRSVRHGGYTGDLKFDKLGQRVNFNLEFIMRKNNTFKRVGTWSIAERLSDKSKNNEDSGFQAIKNKTLIVAIAKTDPYVMDKKNNTNLVGNDRYEGYCIDLMNKLAKELHFNYILREVADGQYGKYVNGSWNGMVKELLDWKADLAIVDLTITKERQSAVDFTHPFMTLGIAIMYKKPKMEEAEMYSFLMPFSKEVWLSMWSAYVATSLALWLVSRLSPLEWRNPHPCFDNPDEKDLENEIHSIGASLWFTIGSLMQQGSDLAPRSPSVRALASVWYFFTLILISSYTANFAAFLTASRMQSPIESAEDLSKQTKIDYGCKEGGSTQAFFADSDHTTYRRMWNFMESRKHQGVFPSTNLKGINMVKKGNFAFLMESTSIEYMVQRDCELMQIGGLLDHKGYGIALRKRSPFRAPLSKSIVELNERGELQDLKNKWWNSESNSNSTCVEQKDSALATSELGIDKVGGVFVLLAGGVAIASISALLEFLWKSLKTSRDDRESIDSMLWHEVMRIIRCGTSKRTANNSTYNRTNSHLSMTNLNDQSAANSYNNNINNSSNSISNSNLNNKSDFNVGLYANTPVAI